MCFPRKPSLGHYSGNRAQWTVAYRAGRIAEKCLSAPDPSTSGLPWKARLIVSFERHAHQDPLSLPVSTRLAARRLINEIVEENRPDSAASNN